MNDNLSQIVEAAVRDVLSADTKNSGMTLDFAKRLAAKIELKAAEIGVNAVVAVSNPAARPVLVECMDNSYIASYDIALKKAYTSVALKMPTKKLSQLAQPGGSLYGIQFTNDGQLVIFGGGEPLSYNGEIIGGLGVSGGTEEQDTFLAKYGADLFAHMYK